jgi:hypothetical protein
MSANIHFDMDRLGLKQYRLLSNRYVNDENYIPWKWQLKRLKAFKSAK